MATNRVFSYKYVPTLKKMSMDNSFMRAAMGPFGSGKSSAFIAIEVAKRSMQQVPDEDGVRRTKWAVVRNSYPQLRDTTIPTFMYWCGHLGEYKSSEYDFRFTHLFAPDGSSCESLVHFRPLDKPQDVKNLLSLEVTGAVFNEVREISKSIVDAMRGRVGRYPPKKSDGTGGASWKGIWMDTNPPDADHWFYKLFEEYKPSYCATCTNARGGMVLLPSQFSDGNAIPIRDRKCPKCHKGYENSIPMTAIYKQPSGFSKEAENIPYLPENYYENLAAGMSPEFIKVYCDGQYGFLKDGRPVYSTWDDLKHLSKSVLRAIPGLPLLIGFDNTGLNQAAVICQYMPWGQLRVLHEFLVREMGTKRFARQVVKPFIMSMYPGVEVIVTGDPAGVKRGDSDERTSFQELDEAGLTAFPAKSNTLDARHGAVEALLMRYLGKRESDDAYGILVSPECKMVHKGFLGGYRLRRLQVVGQERYTDKPEKNEIANVHDALQYAAMAAEEGIRDSVQQQNIVDTPETWINQQRSWDAFV